ncbi:MAG: PAS domain S-box protein, partial [Dehalococcoidia bacterium]|nr:PAS domain S-box protein [Dehalococcoidia bacterium]
IGTLLPTPDADDPTVFVGMRDVTTRAQHQLLTTLQSEVAQMVGAGAPLSETLRVIVATARARVTDRWLAILLLDPSGATLELVAEEGLPSEVVEALRALPLSEAGSCAAAIRDRISVAVPSLTDDLADRSVGAMRAAGFVACRSLPIIDPETDAVLGSLRVLATTPLRPAELSGRLYPALAAVTGQVVNRTRSLARLRESEERFRLTLENAPFGIIVTDLQGRMLTVNRALCALLGYTAEELVGQPYYVVLEPIGREEAVVRFRQLLRGERSAYRVRRTYIAKDGTRIPADISVALVRDAQGEPLQVVVEIEDLRERLRAEEERLARERLAQERQRLESLGLLAGGIAHDFNNLLLSVLGNADLALQDLPDHSPTREVIAQVKRAAERAAALTRQLLAFSGKAQVVTQRVDVRETLAALAEPLRAALPPTVTLTIDAPTPLPMIEADPLQFRQIVTNL